MLYVCWCAVEARHLEAGDLALAQEHCLPWREKVILPLRAQRMAWRGQQDYSAQHAAQYAALKTLEIEAERVQLNFLAALFDDSAGLGEQDKVNKTAPPAAYTALLEEHLQLLARHCGLDQDAFNDLFRALTVAQITS
jgi:hypothetical protein